MIEREREPLSYAELLKELQNLVREARTGTMFILTESEHVARIGLEMGRVVSCIYGKHRGLEAVSLLRRIRSAKYSFTQAVPGSASAADISSHLILLRELVAAPDQDNFSASPASVSLPGESAEGTTSSTPVAQHESSPDTSDLRVRGDELFETVARELAMYLGPVARMVAEEYEQELSSATSSEQVRAIVLRLAQEIGETRQATDFEKRILNLVTK